MDRRVSDLAVFVVGSHKLSTFLPEIVIHVSSIGEIQNHISKLPSHIKKIAWVDDRVVFSNNHWIEEASELLDRCQVCQLFESVYNVDAEGRIGFANHSIAYRYVNKLSGTLEEYDYGFAWAANIKWVEQIGLVDPAIMSQIFCNYSLQNSLQEHERQWFINAKKIQGQTGCVRGSVLIQNYHQYKKQTNFSLSPVLKNQHVECDVIIPYCQNNLRWLKESVDSILNQSGCNTVLHVIADGFEPESYLFDMPIYLYQNKNAVGPYVSANRVFRFLETDYIAIQDSDDIALPHRINFSINEMLRTDSEMFGAGMRQFASYETADAESIEYVMQAPTHISSKHLTWSISPHGVVINGTRVMTKEMFHRMNGFGNYFMSGDCEFTTRCYKYGINIVTNDEIVALRRVHGSSLSRGDKFGLQSDIRLSLHDDIAKSITQMDQLPKEKFGNLNNDYHSDIMRIK